ncbi:MAG: dihydrodipicolinate reductase [Planctomycetes bacterium]|nr:dihydrodipicolinate reductase [Planctomycetota bacterium]
MAGLKVVQVGLGPIGQKTVQYIHARTGVDVGAAGAPAPDKAGEGLAALCSLVNGPSIKIVDNFAATLDAKPDVAVLTTLSSFKACVPQIEEIIAHGIPVVSTCEEMLCPWLTEPELAKQLDESAKKNGVAVLGTGINPGFLMDFLPTIMTAVCQNVTSIKVTRKQDATFRRIPFQQKIGVGLTLQEFEAKRETGSLRHVGLTESLHMIALAMGWKIDKTEDVISPMIADHEIATGYKTVQPGLAAGVQQIGNAYVNGEPRIVLVFKASIGEQEPGDTIEIKGTPDITSHIAGGVNGDIATCAITVNAVKAITKAQPGLRTMTDMPAVSFFE